MICIVSPHFDDAALSCADHARAWLSAGAEPLVVNVFTAAGAIGAGSALMAANLAATGVNNARAYVAIRQAEDHACMQALGLRAVDLGFVDAGFRGAEVPDYVDLRALCVAKLPARELDRVSQVAQALSAYAHARLALCPLAIGGHVDHLITKTACERVFPAARLAYYADMPYARAPWRWTWSALPKLQRRRVSLLTMSAQKRAALALYRSQMAVLFRAPPRYPEILLLPRLCSDTRLVATTCMSAIEP